MQFIPTIKNLKEHIINNNIFKEQTKQLLLEYCDDDTIHSILNITFEELLLSVYDFIDKHKNKNELFEIFNTEIFDSQCKCFTGRISRLINIVINISDAEQIIPNLSS
jgi:hypothetical protein